MDNPAPPQAVRQCRLSAEPVRDDVVVAELADREPDAATLAVALALAAAVCTHKRLHGTMAVGPRQGAAKLSYEKVAAIRRRHSMGETLRGLAREYGVVHSTVRAIVINQSWLSLSDPSGE